MTNLTRRSLFGAGAAGLAGACATPAAGPEAPMFEGAVAFEHGVASGDPTQTNLVIWTRVTPEGEPAMVPVNWTVMEDGVVARSGVFETGPGRDYTVKVDVDGLKPGVLYTYAFAVAETASPEGKARTLPASGDAPFKAAVVSCSNYPFGYFNGYAAIAEFGNVDAVIHLGDYLYEYGPNGYGAEKGVELGREHVPARETVSLADYRQRHAQYKTDPDLQACHAAAPWFCGWDDHESTNNSYRTGAENHQPETEGGWTERKAVAVQAYLEWMPVRDPVAGRNQAAIYRSFDIGDVATLVMLETRLIGRSDELNWADAASVPEAQIPAKLQEIMAATRDPSRTMLGADQEAWVADRLKASVDSGKTWQILGNQVIMAKVASPDLSGAMTVEQKEALYAQAPFAKRLVEFSALGLPMNLDAWDGFVAARERLYADAKAAGARLVAIAGDTHTAWANELHDAAGDQRGVEFGCTSITSPGLGALIPAPGLNEMMTDKNDDVVFYDAFNRGYTLLTVTKEKATAEFVTVNAIESTNYTLGGGETFEATATETGVSKLTAV